jgi:uncharacterized membrane protein YidH (DUF202 family)
MVRQVLGVLLIVASIGCLAVAAFYQDRYSEQGRNVRAVYVVLGVFGIIMSLVFTVLGWLN